MFSLKNSTNSHFPNHNLAEIAIKSGFKFRDIENRKLDWKSLGCVDVNKVVDSQDYDFLQKIIPKIIEAPMQPILGASVLDPAVSSLFRLAQLSLQYLSFCQQFMDYALFDLRTAYSHLQKKNSSLRQNFKRLEEEYYKALEKIQILQSSQPNSISNDNNFQQTTCEAITKEYQEQQTKLQSELKALKEKMNAAEREIVQMNNNNIIFDSPNISCETCAKKTDKSFSTVAVQCDVKENADKIEIEEASLNNDSEAVAFSLDDGNDNPTESTVEEITVKPNDTIATFRAELQKPKNALDDKTKKHTNENQTHKVQIENGHKISSETKEKIDEIQQKFTNFEVMYAQSQNHFIETFKNLDKQQKNYMLNIQDSIREIVEKSLVKYGSNLQLNTETKEDDVQPEPKPIIPVEAKVKILCEQKKVESNSSEYSSSEEQDEIVEEEEVKKPKVIERKPNIKESKTVLFNESKKKERPVPPIRPPSKEEVLKEFEQRLEQFGVDSNASGLSLPLRHEVAKEIAEERKEIKRAHKSFSVTRNKLKEEIEKIAKSKMATASSETSSDKFIDDKQSSEEDLKRKNQIRPKSANVIKRREKSVLRQFIGGNDIDEDELMDKMKMAQKAIDAHRESIQELLQTATHSPKDISINEMKAAKMGKIVDRNDNDDASTKFNKMPNVTSRRVVFVNLDEDS